VSVVLVLRAVGPGICCISISGKGFLLEGSIPALVFTQSPISAHGGPVSLWVNVVGA